MLNLKTYIFNHFYQQYLVLLTMVPRSINSTLTRARLDVRKNTYQVVYRNTAVYRTCPKEAGKLFQVRIVFENARSALIPSVY